MQIVFHDKGIEEFRDLKSWILDNDLPFTADT